MTLEDKVRRIKLLTLEEQYPMFSDTQIQGYLEVYEDVDTTCYELLCLKAEQGGVAITGMTLPDQRKYFMSLALKFRPNHSGVL